ncbi:MAG: HD domain-containing protein [Candidatus Marinimicrobia bacterium]|nr:HD domain-containing protein [Candidatus Neomarinimicrobiota bacterium]
MSIMKDIAGSHKSFEDEKDKEKKTATFSNLIDIQKSLSWGQEPNSSMDDSDKQFAPLPKTKINPIAADKKNASSQNLAEPFSGKSVSGSVLPSDAKQPADYPSSSIQSSQKFKIPGNSKELYIAILKILKTYTIQIEHDEKIDVSNLLPLIPQLVKYTIEGNELLIAALHPGRSVNWFCSHSLNTAIISIKIGHGLQYNTKQLYALTLAALLHDVGMLKINPVILTKPGKFNQGEREELNNHTKLGAEILMHLSSKYPFVIKTILEEHEKWDGNGYPNQLKGEEITPFARIISLADKFESLVHERNYRPGFKPPAAIQKLIQENQSDFDPKVLKSFINEISMYPVGSHVLLNNGQIARVMSVNKNRPVRPLVQILTNSEGKKLDKPYILNLEKEPLSYITKSVNFLN